MGLNQKYKFIDLRYDNYLNETFDSACFDNKIDDLQILLSIISSENIDMLIDFFHKYDRERYKLFINRFDEYGETALHHAIFISNLLICEILLKFGANPNIKNKDGETCIYRLIFSSNKQLVDLLLKYNGNINVQDINGNTPLHVAILSKNYVIIEKLILCGAIIYLKNNWSLTPLNYANDDINIVNIFTKYF